MRESLCSIIILNWNGWRDTIECLSSLYNQTNRQFDIILIDNASGDESVERIRNWARQPVIPEGTEYTHLFTKPLPDTLPYIELESDNEAYPEFSPMEMPRLFFIKNKENIGFARASNQGIRFAQKYLKTPYHYLLNNDTFVHPQALQNLIQTVQCKSVSGALQSAIYYYDNPGKIWHAGGIILPWIQTRYYKDITKDNTRKTYSLSGCALFLPDKTIRESGYLFEKFFHGEEDLNYSLRLLKSGKHSFVVNTSIVYHKISQSSDKSWANRAQRFTNAALNRLVNAKYFFSPIKWNLWAIGTLIYYFILLTLKYKQSFIESIKLLISILKISKKVNYIDKTIVNSVIG